MYATTSGAEVDRSRYASALAESVHRRNLWLMVALAMTASNVMLCAKVASTSTQEKTIITPPVIEKAFWVHGNKVSPEYLEMMATYFAGLALTYTKDNIEGQTALFLRFTDPEAHGVLSAQLSAEAEKIRRNNLSSVFYPVQVRVRDQDQRVAVTGDLVTMVGEQITGRRRATFALHMSYRNGRLYVAEFRESDNEKDPFVAAADTDTDAAAGAR